MYQKITLPNGVRILSESVPNVRSAAIGIWIGGGSRQERASESGASHFIEHMLFKGTQTRTAVDIARETDAIGGQINAFTTKECTCFYARVLDTHLSQALDILFDMLYHSRFDESDVEMERGVISEEIGMYQDTPDDLCAERLFASVFKGSALSRPILGRTSTLSKFTGESLNRYRALHYHAQNTVISIAGSFDASLIEEVSARFSVLTNPPAIHVSPANYTPAITVKKKAIEQNHLTLAFPGLSFRSPERFSLQLLSSILGGGMSSRLFQELREKRGLCYSVYSYGAGHADTGLFAVYAALNRDMEAQALETICTVIRQFAKDGPTKEELERAREQSKSNVLMGLESTQSRMSHMGRSELFMGVSLSPDDIIDAYDAVTLEEVCALSRRIFRFEDASLSAVGRVSTPDVYATALQV
ncbi:MAG: pitrilysin family protein [Evtepia sp.]